MKIIKKVFMGLIVVLSLVMMIACDEEEPVVVTGDPVTITVAGSWTDCRGIQEIGLDFTKKYPNVTVEYENLQDYYNSLMKRMNGNNQVDLFFTSNIQASSKLVAYAVDLNNQKEIDLSNTFAGLAQNFLYREDNEITNMLYSIPVGAEMRGLYVNKTLLSKYGLKVPTNQTELLNACQVLRENNITALHSNPGEFATMLLYPWICNLIANADDYEATYNKVDNHEEGLTDLFLEPYEFLEDIVVNKYYDYKTAQTEKGFFVESGNEFYVKHFLNIDPKTDTKIDDIGQIAFLPQKLSLLSSMNKAKEDYHSNIEYEFIPAPVSKDGGFVYLSPAHAIAINKNTPDLEWSVKFFDFMFQPENNKKFCEYFSAIPNTKEAFNFLKTKYNVPADHVSHLGQVTFSYEFYDIIKASLTELSKANNEKYMINLNKNESSQIQYELDENNEEYLLMFDGKTKVYKKYVGEEDSSRIGKAYCTLDYYIDKLKEKIENEKQE